MPTPTTNSKKTYTDAEITARGREALQKYAPYSMRRAVDPNTLNFVQGTVGSGNRYQTGHQDYAGVERGNPTDIHIEDVDAFMDPDNTPQLAMHEYTHVLTNRLHPTIQAKIPETNEQDPYNYGGDEGLRQLRKSGKGSTDLSREQMAAVGQQFGALMTGYRKAQEANQMTQALRNQYLRAKQLYEPLLDHLASQPTTIIQPTAPDAKTINTTPVDPPLPSGNVAGMEAFEKATQLLPTDDTDLGFQPSQPTDDDIGFKPLAAVHDEVGFKSLPATPGAIDMTKVAGAVPGMGTPHAPSIPVEPTSLGSAVFNNPRDATASQLKADADAVEAGHGEMFDYGQDAGPSLVQGAHELATPGERVRGAADVLRGVNEGLGGTILPLGSAPAAVAKGIAGSVAGSVVAPKVVKALGGNQDAQDLAREAGAIAPMIGGVGASLLEGKGRVGEPEILAPERQEPAGNMPGPQPKTIEGKLTHPAGKVTGIDQETGLPIVDRAQPSAHPNAEATMSAEGENLPPQSATAGPMSPEAEKISADAERNANVPRGTDATIAPHANNAPLPTDAETGRPILQNSDNAEQLRQEAKEQAPALEDKLNDAVADIPGAKVEAVRDEKAPERVTEKADSGKPVETQPDHLAARIVVDSEEAKDQVAERLAQIGEVRREDNFTKAGGSNDFRADTHQVIVNDDPNAALKTAEVQVLTPEQAKTSEDTHDLYERQRTAAANGDTELAERLGKELSEANNAAAKEAETRQTESTPDLKGGNGVLPEPSAGAQTPAEPLEGSDGSETSVLTPSRQLPARYRLVEVSDLIPSHDAHTFAKNPRYPENVQERAYDTSKEAQNRVIQQSQNYDPRYTVNSNPDAVNGPPIITPDGIVLGGNSRAMSTQRHYRQGGDVYRDYLKQHAGEFGFKPGDVGSLKQPVLVREVERPANLDESRRIGSELNKSMTGALGVSEKAVSAGKNIHPDTLRRVATLLQEDDSTLRELMGRRGPEIVKMLVNDGVITDRERPQFVDTATGGLSEEGKTFVERALLGSVVDDPRLMDAAPKSILQKLERSLGSIASFAPRADEWNLLPALRAAVAEHAAIQRTGSNVETRLGQSAMFGPERNPLVDALIRKLDQKPNAVREAFETYAKDADANLPGQGRMFGTADAFEAFNHAFGSKLSKEDFEHGLAESTHPTEAAAQPEHAASAPRDAGLSERSRPDQNSSIEGSGRGLPETTSGLPQTGQVKPSETWKKGDTFLATDANGQLISGTIEHYNPSVNGGKPGGRATLSDGRKLNAVPASAKPLQTIDQPIPKITGSEIEKTAIRQAEEEQPRLVQEYLSNPRNRLGGVLTIATDAAKDLFPPFRENPTTNDRDVASAASRIAKVVQKNALAQPVDPAKPVVQIATASPGSGKTASNSAEASNSVGLKIESIMDDHAAASKLLQQIIDSGRRPSVKWVYVDNLGKTVDRMFRRAIGTEKKPGIGRTVQLNYMADAYKGIPEVLEKLQKEFKGKVDFSVTDNSGEKGSVPTVSTDLQPYIDKIKAQPYPDMRYQIHETLDKLRNEGLFESDQGRRALAAAETTDRPDAQNPRGTDSSGSTERGGGNGEAVSGQPELRGSVLDKSDAEDKAVHDHPSIRSSDHLSEPDRPTGERSKTVPEDSNYRSQVKAAQQRSLKENASLQQSKVVNAAGRKAVVLDANGLAVWHRVFGQRGAELGAGTPWRGMTLEKAAANRAVTLLRAAAGSARTQGLSGDLTAADGYERLAKTLQDARDKNGAVTLLRGDYRPDTAHEEAVHAWQMDTGLDTSPAMRDVARRPEFVETAKRLQEMGYDGVGSHPNELASEMMAKAIAGDPELKLTEDQRYDLVHSFLSKVVEEEGSEILEDMPTGDDPAVKLAVQEARRTYEHDNGGQNEGGHGQEARGPDREEPAGVPDGARGRDSLQSRPGGQHADAGIQSGHAGAGKEKGELEKLFQREPKGTGIDDTAKSMSDLIAGMKEMPSGKMSMADTLEESIGRSIDSLKSTASATEKAVAKLNGTMAGLWRTYAMPPEFTDFKRAAGDMQLSEAITSQLMQSFADEIKRIVPKTEDRIALTHWIEANGNEKTLKDWALRTSAGQPKSMPGNSMSQIKPLTDRSRYYDLATKLTPEQKELGTKIQQHFRDQLAIAQRDGLLFLGARNYVLHMYEKASQGSLLNMIATDELNPNPGFIKRRIFRNFFEAEEAGETPKTKDIGHLVAAYDKSFTQALASRQFIRSLLDAKASDGRPIAAMQGPGQWITASDEQLATVLKQRTRPENLHDYKTINAPQFRNFLWEPTEEAIKDLDLKLFDDDPDRLAFKGNIVIHPQYASRIEDMITPSWFERNPVGRGVLKASSMAKELMTFLSPFHQFNLSVHSVEHTVNPFDLPLIDLSDKDQAALVSHGLKIADIDAEGLFDAKLMKGILEPIPGVNRLADVAQSYSHYLFSDYIPRMKMKMAVDALHRNVRRYNSKYSPDEILEMTAKQSNAAFGGLNHVFDAVPRTKTFQSLIRLLTFAPDFLEARTKFVAQALKPGGAEQRMALIRGALIMYVGARVLNAVFNHGDAKWDVEHAFSIVINGKSYSLRTVQGDLLHAATDPRSFIYNRLNPLVSRPTIEFLTGRDQYGRQKSLTSQVKDVGKSVLPFGAQKVMQTSDEGWLDSLLTSSGINASRYRTPTEERVHKLYLATIPDLPDDEERQASNRRNTQIEDKLRSGHMTTSELWNKVKAGEISPRDASRVYQRSQKSRLALEYNHLKLRDAMDIYEHATVAEKMELRPMLARKAEAHLQDLPQDQKSEMFARLEKDMAISPAQ